MCIKFKPKIYKILLFLCMVLIVFYQYDGTSVVMRNRLATVALAFIALFFQANFEKSKRYWTDVVVLGAFSAGAAYLCCQLFLDCNIFISPAKILGTVCFYLGIFALIFAVTLKTKAAAIGTVSLAAIVSLIETYVFAFRGTSFKLVDIFAIRTAAEVVGDYHFFVNTPMVTGALLYLASIWVCIFGVSVPKRTGWKIKERLILLVLTGIFVSVAYAQGAKLERIEYQFRRGGANEHGVTLNLMCELANGIKYVKPENYEEFQIADMEEEYPEPEKPEKMPHIVVVMNETYSDFRVFNGELLTQDEVMPFADRLKDNTVKGFALASVLGGSTVNSEYEFLTGNTMAFMPNGIAPFQHYVEQDSYSLVSYLNTLGYRSIGVHPGEPLNWMRKAAWEKFGFGEVLFIEDFPQERMIKGRVSDAEFVDVVLELFKKNYQQQPLFLFTVSIQNHSPYNDKSFENTIDLMGYTNEYPEAEQYLSLMRLSDAAMETLVNGLSQIDEDVILLVYGDHQPIVEDAFLEELNGSTFDTLEEVEKRHTVPFYIWANFEIPEQTVELTSLNYLSNYLLESSGLPLPAYNQYLKDVEKTIPAINSLGYWSKTAGAFRSHADASGEEKDVLDEYSAMQYHGLFEKENRSQVFFPN